MVPIIEPDISRDGDHDLTRSLEVSEQVLAAVYKALADYHVYLEGTVLKPSMVTSGTKCQSQASPDQVAHLTLLGKSKRNNTKVLSPDKELFYPIITNNTQ